MCYGLIYGEKEGLDHIGIQMTYSHLDTEIPDDSLGDFSMEKFARTGIRNCWMLIINGSHTPFHGKNREMIP